MFHTKFEGVFVHTVTLLLFPIF